MSGADLPASLGPTSPRSSPPKTPHAAPPPPHDDTPPRGLFARAAAATTAWAERWVPDAYVFALVATFVALIAGTLVAARSTGSVASAAHRAVNAWGSGFWELLPFTLQMALVIITGYVVATSPPAYRLIAAAARVPRDGKQAVAWVALFAMLSSWVNWGFGLIFSAMLAKEVARSVRVRVDYRALAAASFLGLGSVWAQGLSGSAALQMASAASMQPAIRDVVRGGGVIPDGVIPLSKTIFLWQSLASVLIELVVVTLLMYFATPTDHRAKTAQDLGVSLGASPLDREEPTKRGTPGEWLEHSPLLSVAFVALSTAYLLSYFQSKQSVIAALDLNTINLIFLTVGILLHKTPARLMRAVREATPGVWGVILQFPLYAGIAGVVVKTRLNETIAHAFVSISTPKTFPAVVAVYSAALGVLVPSGGSKWVIEAPYVLKAAHDLKVNLGWMVAVYDLGEALANLIQPFWMLPVLGLFGLKARDVMGYTFVVFVVLTPIVLAMVTLFAATLPYPM